MSAATRPRKRGGRPVRKCRARMQREGLKDVDELQSYAVHRLEAFLNARGRRLLGWDEILQGRSGAQRRGHVVARRVGRPRGGGLGASGGDGSGQLLLSGQVSGQSLDRAGGARRVGSPCPRPICTSRRRRTCRAARVLGVQANLWTERIATPEYAEYMLYPRVFAVAEIAWSAPELEGLRGFPPPGADAYRRRPCEGIQHVRFGGFRARRASRVAGRGAASGRRLPGDLCFGVVRGLSGRRSRFADRREAGVVDLRLPLAGLPEYGRRGDGRFGGREADPRGEGRFPAVAVGVHRAAQTCRDRGLVRRGALHGAGRRGERPAVRRPEASSAAPSAGRARPKPAMSAATPSRTAIRAAGCLSTKLS